MLYTKRRSESLEEGEVQRMAPEERYRKTPVILGAGIGLGASGHGFWVQAQAAPNFGFFEAALFPISENMPRLHEYPCALLFWDLESGRLESGIERTTTLYLEK